MSEEAPTVWVTNRTDEPLLVTYAYVAHKFVPNVPQEVAPELAQHVFGWGEADKTAALVRLGFVRYSSEMAQGLGKLALFDISEQPPRRDEAGAGVLTLPVQGRAPRAAPQRAA